MLPAADSQMVVLEEVLKNRCSITLSAPLRARLAAADNETLDRLISMRANGSAVRYAVFVPPSIVSGEFLERLAKILSVVSWLLTALFFFVLILYIFQVDIQLGRFQLGTVNASNWTVGGVCLIGLLHGAFVMLQGGLIVSPMGIVEAAAIPFLVAQSVVSKPGGGLKAYFRSRGFIPVAVTIGAAAIGELLARYLSTPTSRLVYAEHFSPWYLFVYAAAVLFGAFSVPAPTPVGATTKVPLAVP